MYLSEVYIENFRIFGEGDSALRLSLKPGLTALVGENDAGKTAIIDAIRISLGTSDQEFSRVKEDDFHLPDGNGVRSSQIRIRCKFEDLNLTELGAFVEHLSYEKDDESRKPVLYLNWRAKRSAKKLRNRRYFEVDVRSGELGDGPVVEGGIRFLLASTYLRPLRDAETALSSGRRSRLSQILLNTREVVDSGFPFDPETDSIDVAMPNLSLVGIADLADKLLADHEGIQAARQRLNSNYLKRLSFSNDQLSGSISVAGADREDDLRVRQLLEKLEISLVDSDYPERIDRRGLGSSNLLFVACELLLMVSDEDGFPLLLVEEPEAHLHPQRQLLLAEYFQGIVSVDEDNRTNPQIIFSTHSPNLASKLSLEQLVLIDKGRAFRLSKGETNLSESDYGFLERFLDVTKANLFFARGVIIVEGDSESLLVPTFARILGVDLTASGVSIVNVGGTGLRRFARILQRSEASDIKEIEIPVACVTDSDVMPDCAPEILRKVKRGQSWPEKKKRRWRAESDFTVGTLKKRIEQIESKASGQNVETFVAKWTFEYHLAIAGLERELWCATQLAKFDDKLNEGTVSRFKVLKDAIRLLDSLRSEFGTNEELASRIYAEHVRFSKVSKATTAQYLAEILDQQVARGKGESLRDFIPKYLKKAIEHVVN